MDAPLLSGRLIKQNREFVYGISINCEERWVSLMF